MVNIDRIVAAALRAPSGDNCQPFRFRWDGRGLDVVQIADRATHVLDTAHHPSLLTLGMIAECVTIAARAQGYEAAFEQRPPQPDRAWLRVSFSAGERRRDPLYDGLQARHTDRRLFLGGDVRAPELLRCDREATDHIYVDYAAPERLATWLHVADAAMWRAPKIAQDALEWVRFDERTLRRRGDGVSWRNLGLPSFLAAGVAVSRRLPMTLRAGAVFGGPALTATLLRQQLASSAAIVAIGADDTTPACLLRAGRVAWRVWASLNLAGWGVQPMSMGPVLCMVTRDRRLPEGIPARVGTDMLAELPRLRRAFGQRAPWFPVFMMRTGRMTPLDARLRPPRRALAEVLERSGDA